MGIIYTILIGFIVGLVARALMPGKDALGFIITALLGVGGAILGKFIGEGLGLYGPEETAGFFMSLIGAMILLFIYNHFVRRNQAP